jgi:hypothetical protein
MKTKTISVKLFLAGDLVFFYSFTAIYRRERALSIHYTGGWVGPTASLDIMAKRKISSGNQTWIPQSFSP